MSSGQHVTYIISTLWLNHKGLCWIVAVRLANVTLAVKLAHQSIVDTLTGITTVTFVSKLLLKCNVTRLLTWEFVGINITVAIGIVI